MKSDSLKKWIVRDTAFSIQCGGLERLKVHFTKPEYFYIKLTDKQRDTPFGYVSDREGLFYKVGWSEPDAKSMLPSISLGQFIGYDNEISHFVWDKLVEHFHNEPFDNWHIVEREGRSRIEDFCLELNISISINL